MTFLLIVAAICTIGFPGCLLYGLCVSARVADDNAVDAVCECNQPVATVALPDPLEAMWDLECAADPKVRA